MTNIEDFSDLTTLSRREVQSAFRSIVDFPHEEVILGATSASLRETLDRICFVLTDDQSVMPAALCYQINASCKPDEDLQSGANYAAGAAVVQANFETWRRSTTD